MRSLSIKYFILFAVIFLLLGTTLTLFQFYKNSEKNISKLLTNNIQTEILNMKHYLKTNLNKNNINELISHLDSISSSSKSIHNIHIFNEKKLSIYATERVSPILNKECTPISKITRKEVLEEECYSFNITLYNNLTPYFFTSEVYIDKQYLHQLLKQQTIILISYYALLVILFFLLLWIMLKKTIIVPLEELRQFAYYSNTTPKKFFINEIESIRHSLSMTFARLKKEQEELYKLSTKDTLSGLYNRMSLIDKIEWLIASSDRDPKKFAVIFFDLDNFKTINDSQGHVFGDKVLQNISNILLKSVRDHDIVSRVGGDEFVILLPSCEKETIVVNVLERIKEELAKPFHLDDHSYHLTASMGVSLYPRDGKDSQTLLKHADIAMYRSKELGKNTYHFFTESLNRTIEQKIAMQNLIETSLQNNYFELYFQPKTDVISGKIVACEALIRLIDPKKGLIPPDMFIPLAEESSLIIAIGEWVVLESSRVLQKWQHSDLQDIKMSINISAKHFNESNLISMLQEVCKKIDKSRLDIELTESVFVNNFEHTLETIKQVKALGLTLSLDDFGTGYSSLSYLKNIPFDTLKIDKIFIDDLESKKGKSFVNMIINIANSLELEVVAEGVEEEKQLSYLQKMGCNTYQGYLCSKPLPLAEFEALCKRVNNSN